MKTISGPSGVLSLVDSEWSMSPLRLNMNRMIRVCWCSWVILVRCLLVSLPAKELKRVKISLSSSLLNRNTKHNTLIVIYKTMRILWIDTIKFPLFFFPPNVIFYSCMWFLIGKWENNWVADVENVFFMSNVQISWKFIIYWIPRCLYTWKNIKISKAVWLIRLLQVVLPPP